MRPRHARPGPSHRTYRPAATGQNRDVGPPWTPVESRFRRVPHAAFHISPCFSLLSCSRINTRESRCGGNLRRLCRRMTRSVVPHGFSGGPGNEPLPTSAGVLRHRRSTCAVSRSGHRQAASPGQERPRGQEGAQRQVNTKSNAKSAREAASGKRPPCRAQRRQAQVGEGQIRSVQAG